VFEIGGFCNFSRTGLLDMNMYVAAHSQYESAVSESVSDVAYWLRSESASLLPALLGSLSVRRRRCVRKNCAACQSGEQHKTYVLYSRAHGRRVAVYLPEELVSEVQRRLDNGRALQDLLHQAAPRLVKAFKRAHRDAPASPKLPQVYQAAKGEMDGY
jgi:uncharacterized protein DUF6788